MNQDTYRKRPPAPPSRSIPEPTCSHDWDSIPKGGRCCTGRHQDQTDPGRVRARLEPAELLRYTCNWIQMSFSCQWRKCNSALIPTTFIPLSPPVAARTRPPPRHVLVLRRDVSHAEREMNIWRLRACRGVRRRRAHKWAASCHRGFTSSFLMYSTVECAVAQRGRVITCTD